MADMQSSTFHLAKQSEFLEVLRRGLALGFVLSQHCSFGNLCSQAGSYTHSVQIPQLFSVAWTLLQKRGNRNKVQVYQEM